MGKPARQLRCFIASFNNRAIDPELTQEGFCQGLLAFAIPEFGILFRCRAEGDLIDLEFGAFLALMKFTKDKLKGENVKAIQVLSSNPEFVFSFTGHSRHVAEGSQRMKMLKEYSAQFQIAVGIVEPLKNQVLIGAADYPSMPDSQAVSFGPESEPKMKPTFKPFQRGIRL